LTRDGQSIGRKLLRIKIVRHDHGGRAGFARVVLVREIVNGLIGSIPFVSYVYALVDSLFIFGHERRCLHDYLAGTKVVTAASPRRRYRRPAETPAARGSRPAASSTVSHAAPSD
ncbi:MAG: RDD family protein, partial [Planctomycetes bacterium]|nr:RDD family protein [Planctomycetota bacterium]